MEKSNLRKIVNNSYFIFGENTIDYTEDIYIIEYTGKIEVIYRNKKYNIDEFTKQKYFEKKSSIVFRLDFTNDLNFTKANTLIKYIIKIDKIAKSNKIKIGFTRENKIILGNVIKGNSEYENDIISAIGVLMCKDKKQKYEFLYDQICSYLDDKVVNKNVCEFKNDKCIAKRNTNCTMGCCHHFRNKYFGILYEKELHICKYQKNKRCIAKCISCKMYMCDYLRKKGYNFNCNNVLLVKYYFNILQKMVIKISFFTKKDVILKRIYLLCMK